MKINGRRLRLLRLRNFLSQRELAELAGVTKNVICAEENMLLKSTPDSTLKKLARALNVKSKTLFKPLGSNELAELHLLTDLRSSTWDFGKRLRFVMKLRKLNFITLAAIADLSPSTVWYLEKSMRRPIPRTIRKLAAALQIKPETLCGKYQRR